MDGKSSSLLVMSNAINHHLQRNPPRVKSNNKKMETIEVYTHPSRAVETS